MWWSQLYCGSRPVLSQVYAEIAPLCQSVLRRHIPLAVLSSLRVVFDTARSPSKVATLGEPATTPSMDS